MIFLILNILTLVLVSVSDSAKILAMFPTPSISHQVVFRPLTQALAQRGHEVIVITPDPAFPKGEAPANLIEIDVHNISYTTWRNHFLKTTTGKSEDMLTQIKIGLSLIRVVFEQQLKNEEVKAIVNDRNLKFDLILLEAYVRPALVLSHIFKAPVILISSLGFTLDILNVVGVPAHPVLYPSLVRQKLHNLTLWEKIKELYIHYYMEYIFHGYEEIDMKIIRKHFGQDTPSLNELSKNVNMLFLNVHPIWEANRPVPPNVLYIGGIHIKPDKPLPQNLKSYLDSSKNGVIYISFGTNVMPSMLPAERIQILVNVFSKLPYDVLWKWDKDILPGQTSNIRIEKWLPQSDLLRHPKIKLFITQGGLQSTDEAIAAGVPLIGIPLLGDQWYNVEHYAHHGIGLRLDMETLTEKQFRDAINSIVKDNSYHNNIAKFRDIMNDQPQRPLERAVWWTEHLLRHGGARHLQSPAANIPWTQYYELELVAVILVGIMLSVLLFIYILRSLWIILQLFFGGKKIKMM